MTGPEGNSEFCFPRRSRGKHWDSKETNHCSPRDQSLSDLLYSKANGSNWWKNNHVIDKWRATAVNISRVTVNCFSFDVTVFAMLPAHGVWRETVSLLDVMWPWTSQWMGALKREKSQLYNNLNYYTLNSLSLFWLTGSVQWIFEMQFGLKSCTWFQNGTSQQS